MIRWLLAAFLTVIFLPPSPVRAEPVDCLQGAQLERDGTVSHSLGGFRQIDGGQLVSFRLCNGCPFLSFGRCLS